MALEAGAAYLDIFPRLAEGFGKKLTEDAVPEAEEAGRKTGNGFRDKVAVAGLAGAAALSAGFAESLDIAAANDKLAAQLGLNEKTADVAGKAAANLYKGAWGDSMETVNDAIKSVGTNLVDLNNTSGGDVEHFTSRVLDLSSAFDVDFNESTKAAAQLVKTGLVPNMESAFDVITVGFQKGVNSSDDFLDTLNEYAQPFKSLGLNAQEATGILNQGLKAGARNGDLVADALKEFAIRSKDASTTSAQGYQLIGLNAATMTAQMAKGGDAAKQGLDTVLDRLSKMTDPVKRNAAAVDLFGTQAEDLQGALFAIDPSTAVQGLGDVTGAAGKMSAELNGNAKTTLESFKREALMGITNIIGGTLLPKANELTDWVSQKLGPNFNVAKDIVIGVMIAMAAAVTVHVATIVAGWIWMGVQASINAVKTVASWIATGASALASAVLAGVAFAIWVGGWIWMGIQAVVSAAIVVGGWIATGAAAVAAGLVMIVQVGIQVGAWILLGVQALASAALVAAAWLLSIWPIALVIAAVVGLVIIIVKNWDTISSAIADGWHWVQNVSSEVWNAIWSTIKSIADTIVNIFLHWTLLGIIINHFEDIKHGISSAINWIGDRIDDFVGLITGLPGRVSKNLSDMWVGMRDGFKDALNFVIRHWNDFSISIPEFDTHIPGVGKIGGWTLDTSNIPLLEKGGLVNGLAVVADHNGKNGELISVGQTSRVFPHSELMQALGRASGGGGVIHNHYELTVHGGEQQSVIDQFRTMERLGLPLQS